MPKGKISILKGCQKKTKNKQTNKQIKKKTNKKTNKQKKNCRNIAKEKLIVPKRV
jgi:hypothetical protein